MPRSLKFYGASDARDAAGALLNKIDADHITEVRAASWARATDVLARALDEFARQAVERKLAALRSNKVLDAAAAAITELCETEAETNDRLAALAVLNIIIETMEAAP